MTLEQVSKITQMLSTARLSAYLEKASGHAYLYAVADEEMNGVLEPVFGSIAQI
ncbi:MAG: hypothetical protein KGH63_04815 [Candidatus Micrarchaeota archaeon]|nr:hypothetical protein [Candidatus Micrarchaeota archaeon]